MATPSANEPTPNSAPGETRAAALRFRDPETGKTYPWRAPQTKEDLARYFLKYFGYTLSPNVHPDCIAKGHTAPLDVAWALYSATHPSTGAHMPIAVLKGSRGLSGKSTMLAAISTLEGLAGLSGVVLGGSLAQSKRVHDVGNEIYMRDVVSEDGIVIERPFTKLIDDPTATETRFMVSGVKRLAIAAGPRSARSPHPVRLRCDEIDEMKLDILDAALGQTMSDDLEQKPTQTALVSTHQHPAGCVHGDTQVLTPHGEVPVTEISTGDQVMTRHGWRRVVDRVLTGYRPVVRVELSNGRTLVCTDDHRIALAGGGWSIPRWMWPGQEIAGINPDLILSQPSVGSGFHSQPLSTDAPLFAGSQSLAGLTQPAALFVPSSVRGGKGMPFGTNVLTGVASGGANPTERVGFAGDDLHVVGVHARPVATQVVDRQPVFDRADQTEIGPAVGAAVEVLAVDPSIPLAFSPLPNPATPHVDDAPLQEPVTIVGISHTSRVLFPVYDVEVEGVHEFVGDGVVVHNTMTEVLKRAGERGWPVFEYCYRDCLDEVGGWLSWAMVNTKRHEVSDAMWRAEYELQEPSAEGRAILTESVVSMWSESMGVAAGDANEYIEVLCCTAAAERKEFYERTGAGDPPYPCRDHQYATGADWGRDRDWTIIATYKVDGPKKWLVAWERTGVESQPWPAIVERLNWRAKRFPGSVCHDATGMGGKHVHDTLNIEAEGVTMVGAERTALLMNYIKAIENGEFGGLRVEYAYNEHRYVTMDDLFKSGSAHHAPDSFVAGAMALRAAGQSVLVDLNPDALAGRGVLDGVR